MDSDEGQTQKAFIFGMFFEWETDWIDRCIILGGFVFDLILNVWRPKVLFREMIDMAECSHSFVETNEIACLHAQVGFIDRLAADVHFGVSTAEQSRAGVTF